MKISMKRLLTCLLAVTLIGAAGNVYAAGDNGISAEEDTGGEKAGTDVSAKRREVEEKVTAETEHITEYLEKTGTAYGYDVYYRDKDIDDKLWEANGGKPKKKADYTEAQKELAEIIDELKKLGDFTIVDRETGRAAATFHDSSRIDDGLMYVSDAGRYLLIYDSERSRIKAIHETISTVDDPYLFSSADGSTVVITDKKYTKIIHTYSYKGKEGGKTVFKENGGDGFVWLSGDGMQVLGAFEYAAENEKYRMIADHRYANVGIEDRKTGYIWWSSPLGASRDSIATPLIADELRSSVKLRYGEPAKRSNNNYLRSAADSDIEVSDIKGGIRAVYSFAKAGITVPVEYTLEEDHLKVTVKVSDIKEKDPEKKATELTLLGGFGAGGSDEDGYFVIPDGSGALIRFNNGKNTDNNAYSQRVYGSDITAVPSSRGAVTEQIYLPVYGIVKEDNALLAVAAKGDSNAVLSAQVSGQSNSSYNLCSFSFVLRDTDTFYMSGNTSDKITVFQNGDINSDDIEMRYYPISEKGADYSDIAARYREYLLDEGGVTPCAEEGEAPLYIDLYGGVLKKKPVLGIPVTQRQALTTYSQAEEILSGLRDNGADEMIVSYNSWTDDGIRSRVDRTASPSGLLGGKADFDSLLSYTEENGIKLYPASDSRDFYSGGGYSSYGDTALRISGSYSRIVSYDRAYGIPDGFRKNMSLLSPDCFSDVICTAAESYASAGLYGISLGRMTTSLYGDYGKKNITRSGAESILTGCFRSADEMLPGGILADCANAYALPYVSHITGVPLTSSRFDIFNEDIPFIQMVLHGVIPYSTTAVNGDADSDKLLLMAAVTGSLLSYDMLYEETSTLKDTQYDVYYYANYANWIGTAAAEYRMLRPVLSRISGSTMESYSTDESGNKITAVYSNGTRVSADLEKKTVDCGDIHIALADYEAEGGIMF